MTEKDLQRKIAAALRRRGAWVAVQANPYRRGDPDVLACFEGRFVALELKLPGRERTLTKLQERALREIERSGGVAALVTSVDEALEALTLART